MLSPEERRYLRWLTRVEWTDRGHVVEIGPWLGGSTACLAEGMRARSRAPSHRLHSFDDFTWRRFMGERAPLPLEPGESFEPWFRRNLTPWADLVETHAARLPDEEIAGDAEAAESRGVRGPERAPFDWSPAEPIELLFVDGAKSWKALRHLLAQVGPALLPGRTLLVCQDYKYWGCYWVPMLLARLAPRLEPVHDVLAGHTVSFLLREALPAQAILALARDVHAADAATALADAEEAGARLRAAGDPMAAHYLSLSRVAFLAHRGQLDAAREAFERTQRRWPLGAPIRQLERARRHLCDTRGQTLPVRRTLVAVQGAQFGNAGGIVMTFVDQVVGDPEAWWKLLRALILWLRLGRLGLLFLCRVALRRLTARGRRLRQGRIGLRAHRRSAAHGANREPGDRNHDKQIGEARVEAAHDDLRGAALRSKYAQILAPVTPQRASHSMPRFNLA
jgi:hypothetical protein